MANGDGALGHALNFSEVSVIDVLTNRTTSHEHRHFDGNPGFLRDLDDGHDVFDACACGTGGANGQLVVRDLLNESSNVFVLLLARARDSEIRCVDAQVDHAVKQLQLFAYRWIAN